MEVSISDGLAAGAIGLSLYTLWQQRGIAKLTKRLNKLQISKEEGEVVAEKRADLFANFVNVSKNSYQFRIHNRGKGTAKNIRMDVTVGKELFMNGDLEQKFPYPALVTHQPLNLLVSVHMQSPRRASVTLTWDDDAGGGTKDITADVF